MNGARGEVEAVIADEPVNLCLTLGALAEIETALGVTGFQALADRLRVLTAADLVAVLAALIVGGGAEAMAARRRAEMTEPRAAAEAVARAFEAAAG
jgi:uncharacterized protein (DUF1786 family)